MRFHGLDVAVGEATPRRAEAEHTKRRARTICRSSRGRGGSWRTRDVHGCWISAAWKSEWTTTPPNFAESVKHA